MNLIKAQITQFQKSQNISNGYIMKIVFSVFLFIFSTHSFATQSEEINNIKLIDLKSKDESELRSLESQLESYHRYQKSILDSTNDKEKNEASDLVREIENLLTEVRNHIEKDHVSLQLDKIFEQIEKFREIDQSSFDKDSLSNLWNESFSLAMACDRISTENLSKNLFDRKEKLCADATNLAREIKENKDSTPWYWKLFFVLIAIPAFYLSITSNKSSSKNSNKNTPVENNKNSGNEKRFSIAVHKKCATCLYWSGSRNFSKHRTDIIISALDKNKKFNCNNSNVVQGRAKTTCDWSCDHYSKIG